MILSPGPNKTKEQGTYHGDCRRLARDIPDNTLDLILTDPPYFKKDLPLYQWLAQAAARLLKPGGWVLFMAGHIYIPKIYAYFEAQLELNYYMQYSILMNGQRSGVIWTRANGQRKPIIQRNKLIVAYSKGRAVPRLGTIGVFTGTRNDKRYHLQGQAAAPFRYYIDCFSARDDLVFDPFAGGGTTPAMAKLTARRWLAFDIDPKAVATTRQRLADTPTMPDHYQPGDHP
jgi:DNA modification methylase